MIKISLSMPCNIFLHFHNRGAFDLAGGSHSIVLAMARMMMKLVWPEKFVRFSSSLHSWKDIMIGFIQNPFFMSFMILQEHLLNLASGSIRGRKHVRIPCADGARNSWLLIKSSGRWDLRSSSIRTKPYQNYRVVMVGAAEDMPTGAEGVAHAADSMICLALVTLRNNYRGRVGKYSQISGNFVEPYISWYVTAAYFRDFSAENTTRIFFKGKVKGKFWPYFGSIEVCFTLLITQINCLKHMLCVHLKVVDNDIFLIDIDPYFYLQYLILLLITIIDLLWKFDSILIHSYKLSILEKSWCDQDTWVPIFLNRNSFY